MTARPFASLGTIGLLGLLTGCDVLSPGDPPTPYFHAVVQGAIQLEFEGTGKVSWGSGWEPVTHFNLGAWSEDGNEYFYGQIFRRSWRAPKGSYAVTFKPRLYRAMWGRDDPAVVDGWVPVTYFRDWNWQTGATEAYVAVGGAIEITRSQNADYDSYINNRGDGWVEGRFSISAVRYCGGVPGVDYYCVHVSQLPDQLPPGLPRIEITGSFVLTRADSRAYLDCAPICEYEP